eukprot:scaffold4797_cov90-Skeletonema_dohrnii-CCMP3373.AAC.2
MDNPVAKESQQFMCRQASNVDAVWARFNKRPKENCVMEVIDVLRWGCSARQRSKYVNEKREKAAFQPLRSLCSLCSLVALAQWEWYVPV